jgi:hypothetical protein
MPVFLEELIVNAATLAEDVRVTISCTDGSSSCCHSAADREWTSPDLVPLYI